MDHSSRARVASLAGLLCALWVVLTFSYTGAFARAAPARAHAPAAGTGRITGRLLDGSHQNAPLANQSVTLQLAQGNTARDLFSLVTDAQGRYAFSGLQSDPSMQYALYTLYQGAQYVTDLVDLGKNPQRQVNLTVYDATTSTARLAVVQASLLLDKPNPHSGLLTISEDVFFENLGLTTYVGRLDASGRPNALLFALPPGARFLSLATGFDGYRAIQVESGFASNAAVPPGTSEFSFSFQVPYSGTGYDFTYRALYPTLSLALLTPTNLLTTPQGLVSQGPTNTQSGTYQLFLAKRLGANGHVGVQLAGLPVRAQTTPASAGPQLLWLVGLLCVLLLLSGVGGSLFIHRRGRTIRARGRARPGRSTGKQSAPALTRDALLRELLELDKAYEAGGLDKAAYREQRARVKTRLRRLIDREEGAAAAGKAARSSDRGTP